MKQKCSQVNNRCQRVLSPKTYSAFRWIRMQLKQSFPANAHIGFMVKLLMLMSLKTLKALISDNSVGGTNGRAVDLPLIAKETNPAKIATIVKCMSVTPHRPPIVRERAKPSQAREVCLLYNTEYFYHKQYRKPSGAALVLERQERLLAKCRRMSGVDLPLG